MIVLNLHCSKTIVTLHIYVHSNIQHLNALLKEEMSLVMNQPNTLETVGNVPQNYWLIQLPTNANKSAIISLFEESHLRYDTMAFTFMTTKGNLCGSKSLQMIILSKTSK